MNTDILKTVKDMNIFRTLTDKQTELICEISTVDNHTKDYVLCYERTESTKLLFLLDGLAKSYKIDKHDNEIFYFISIKVV